MAEDGAGERIYTIGAGWNKLEVEEITRGVLVVVVDDDVLGQIESVGTELDFLLLSPYFTVLFKAPEMAGPS
jgi:hypothetical protein